MNKLDFHTSVFKKNKINKSSSFLEELQGSVAYLQLLKATEYTPVQMSNLPFYSSL